MKLLVAALKHVGICPFVQVNVKEDHCPTVKLDWTECCQHQSGCCRSPTQGPPRPHKYLQIHFQTLYQISFHLNVLQSVQRSRFCIQTREQSDFQHVMRWGNERSSLTDIGSVWREQSAPLIRAAASGKVTPQFATLASLGACSSSSLTTASAFRFLSPFILRVRSLDRSCFCMCTRPNLVPNASWEMFFFFLACES